MTYTVDLTMVDQPNPRWIYEQVERPLPPIVGAMESAGILVDRDRLAELGCTVDTRIAGIDLGVLDSVNYKSPLQLAHLLYNVVGLQPVRKTSGGAWSTDEKSLKEIRRRAGHAVPIIDTLLRIRSLEKLKSTYVTALLERTVDNPRLHFQFLQHGTETGRFSALNPNMQNMPSRGEFADEFRSCFIAPVGKVLVCSDASQIELRVMAAFSRDPFLTGAFNNDEDIHQAVTTLLGLSDRRVGKNINFGIGYGLSTPSLATLLGVSQREATQLMDEYWRRVPLLKAWFTRSKELLVSNGFVTTMFGRINHYNLGDNDNTNASTFREANNMRVQGTAADIIKLYMAIVHYTYSMYGGCMMLTVHDEVVGEVDEDKGELCRSALEYIGSTVVDIGVPLRWDVHIGRSWQEAKGK